MAPNPRWSNSKRPPYPPQSHSKVAQMALEMLTVITNNVCAKGCKNKPPGLYCGLCRSMNDKATALRWVVGLERAP